MAEGVDRKSYQLAEYFLSDIDGATENDHRELAKEIQAIAEDWCQGIKMRVEAYMSRVGT